MMPAVFLDRDGVLIETRVVDGVPHPPASIDELRIAVGAADALDRLRSKYALVMVTNQPDVARGLATAADVEKLNDAVRSELGLDAVYWCPHDGDACACRKPKPGMVLDAARDLALDLTASWFVGDRWTDVAAAAAAGVRSILLDRPYSWGASGGRMPPPALEPSSRVATLVDAATLILHGGIAPSR